MKIGIFDSGLGGLTVVQAIAKAFQGVQIVYIADTLFAPYGEKSKEQILKHSLDITNYLIQKHKIDALVIACNTATSAAIAFLREEFPNLLLVGTEPGIKPAIKITLSKNIGVLATEVTLNGEKYQELLKTLSLEHDIKIHEIACAGLVEQIENGKINNPQTKNMLHTWLKPMSENRVDTIVLGCTHYPLVSKVIKDIMGANINLIETGSAIAKRLEDLSFKNGYNSQKELKIKVFYTGEIKKEMINMILDTWEDGGKIVIKGRYE